VTRKYVSVGIHVPSAAVAPLGSGEAYAECFRQVEALGLDGVWTEDRLFHSANLLDAVVVLVLNLCHAAVAARQASTLAHLSGGRLALGVSLGGRPNAYQGLGVPVERRVAVFRESLKEPVSWRSYMCLYPRIFLPSQSMLCTMPSRKPPSMERR
jgi:alkanesulfonate monooxygenase SsuD/methylene tetrahydromethanopterin reductase-like flavin-dependent oxidoreductase (luciferase family)